MADFKKRVLEVRPYEAVTLERVGPNAVITLAEGSTWFDDTQIQGRMDPTRENTEIIDLTEENNPQVAYKVLLREILRLRSELLLCVGKLKRSPDVDQRWVAIGTTDIEKGILALRQSVTKD